MRSGTRIRNANQERDQDLGLSRGLQLACRDEQHKPLYGSNEAPIRQVPLAFMELRVEGRVGHWGTWPGWLSETIQQAPSGTGYLKQVLVMAVVGDHQQAPWWPLSWWWWPLLQLLWLLWVLS